MKLFTIEIEGRPIMTFASEDRDAADEFSNAPWLHEDLTVLMHEGRSLWDGKAELFVRAAEQEEASRWEVGFAQARQDGEADNGDGEDYAVFLLAVSDSTDE